MKISYAWLKTWLSQSIDSTALVDKLTMAGLEVDSLEPVAADFANVVVGKVLNCEPHPDADRLTLCQVDVGSETLSIVCGAKNVKADMLVPVAKIGGHVGDLKIKRSKLRGVESFGMICSAKELGLAESSEGIMALPADAPLGESLRDYLDLDDYTIDIDLTPNRGDCLSVEGLAREISALESIDLNPIEINPVAATNQTEFPVTIKAPEACGQYIGRVIKNVDIGKTPQWLSERLRRCGLRSIDPVVDVTNYVMLELGQPMHAFDLNHLTDEIIVRFAKDKESLTLLDGQTIELESDCLVISDQKQCLALAGVMGGENSGVNGETRDIFLESAYFNPEYIAGRARRFGLHTDSSHRFERGVDPQLQRRAIERATALLLDIVGGEPGPIIEVKDEAHCPQARTISLRKSRIQRVLGIDVEAEKVSDLLSRLGFSVEHQKDFEVTVPSYRFDIHLEIDLIEEVARINGYEKLPITLPNAELKMRHQAESTVTLNQIRQVLVESGFREVLSYSFVDPKLQAQLNPGVEAIDLVNPLSPELSQMRTSLWPGLMHTIIYNQNRQMNRIKIFETGLRFIKEDELKQQTVIAGAISGSRYPQQWAQKHEHHDFYDLKNVLEKLLDLTHDDVEFSPSEHPACHPGQCASIIKNNQPIGICGRLHPKLEASLDVMPVFLFELELDTLRQGQLPSFQAFSKYPMIRRDLALILDEQITAKQVIETVKTYGGEQFADVQIFDQYQGAGIKDGQKSIALTITLQDLQRTLTDDEVSATINLIINGLSEKLGATLRE